MRDFDGRFQQPPDRDERGAGVRPLSLHVARQPADRGEELGDLRPLSIPPRRSTSTVTVAALMGVFAALSVLALLGTLLASGIGGVSVFEVENLRQFAASTVATAIFLVLAAFFCGGWAYGALLRRQRRGEHSRDGTSDVWNPAGWANDAITREANMHASRYLGWEVRWREPNGTVRWLWRKLTGVDLEHASFDELVGRIR